MRIFRTILCRAGGSEILSVASSILRPLSTADIDIALVNSSSGPAQFPERILVGLPAYMLSCFVEILRYSSTTARPAGF